MTRGERDLQHIWTSYSGITNSMTAERESFKCTTLFCGLAEMASVWIQVFLCDVEMVELTASAGVIFSSFWSS